MYPILIRQNEATAAYRVVPIWLVDVTDGLTAKTGVTGSVRISKNGGASALSTNSIVEVDATNMPGLYTITLTATEVNTLGHLLLSFKTAATAQWHGFVHVIAANIYSGTNLGLSNLDAAISSRLADAAKPTNWGSMAIEADGMVHADVKEWLAAAPLALVSQLLQVDLKAINADAEAATDLGAAAKTMLRGTVDDTGFTPTTSEFESNDITEATTDHYKGRAILWRTGTLKDQQTFITGYSLVSGRGHFTVETMTEAPLTGDTFVIV